MFTPLAMQHVTLYLVKEEAPHAALALGRFGVFEPGPVEKDGPLAERFGQEYRETFLRAANRLQKICRHLGLELPPAETAVPRVVPLVELRELDTWLGTLWVECSQREERLRHLHEEVHAVRQLDEALDIYEPLDIDLGMLQSEFRFLHVRIGTVPTEDVDSLRQAAGLLGYSLTEFSRGDTITHVVLAGLTDRAAELDRALGAASFTELRLVAEFGAHPREVRRDLARRAKELRKEARRYREDIEAVFDEHRERLLEHAHVLALASAYAQASETLRRRGGLATLSGWVPRDQVSELQQRLQQDIGDRLVLEIRDPRPEETPQVPSATRHPAVLKPFATLVKTYGVPRYGEFDPTWLFTLSFIAMFGMMFGDIGHGAVIAAAGVLMRRLLKSFVTFVVAIGISSMLFGFLYGSLFGYEEVVHALWISPLSDPALMLRLALYWGIGFIMLMLAITIRNRLREKAFAEAFLSGTGLAGALLYVGIIFAAARWFRSGEFRLVDAFAVTVPLAVVLGHEWHRSSGPFGERLVIVLIEGFETLLNYVANTLSFLRVAAFSLNHVALAIAVFTLANMLGPTGHWIVVVLGNLFVLVLEGAIVTIQVLRLEYYEGFSRFFRGDGREFRPLTLGLNKVRSVTGPGT